MRELKVYFDSQRINNEQILNLDNVQNQPKIEFEPEGKYYTILMVDPDAPSRDNPIYKYWLHWMIVNNDETIVEFSPSAPPAGSGLHRYYICLYEQKRKIKITQKYDRKNFSVKDFINKNHLTFIAGVMYKTKSN